jgi:cation transport regulator ChaB
MPGREDLPSTLVRSPRKAQDTWLAALNSAIETYGEGERARRTAFSALKHSFEKVGDRWERKEGGKRGPSDEQAARSTRDSETGTAGGVDTNATKKHLYELARKLDIPGRSGMSKQELAEALRKANNRATAKARSGR